MTLNSVKTIALFFALSAFAIFNSSAQEATVTVNQSPEIDKLLDLKKDISAAQERFKISIYSGNRAAAEAAKENFNEEFPQYSSIMTFEKPNNYKIYVGNFRSRIEADRALLKVKSKFNRAFILKM